MPLLSAYNAFLAPRRSSSLSAMGRRASFSRMSHRVDVTLRVDALPFQDSPIQGSITTGDEEPSRQNLLPSHFTSSFYLILKFAAAWRWKVDIFSFSWRGLVIAYHGLCS
jgi:hypothetical protein